MIEEKKDVLLAIDCSLRWTNVAVFSEKILSARNADIGRRQAAELPDIVELVLREAKVEKNALTHIAVTIGPGYFTGVRVGMAFAAALAFGLGIKVVPVGTLDALMFEKCSENSICLVYAGKNKVYASGFSGKIKTAEYAVPEILKLSEGHEGVIFFSDAPEKVENFGAEIEKIFPLSENVAAVAWNTRAINAIPPERLRADWCKNPV